MKARKLSVLLGMACLLVILGVGSALADTAIVVEATAYNVTPMWDFDNCTDGEDVDYYCDTNDIIYNNNGVPMHPLYKIVTPWTECCTHDGKSCQKTYHFNNTTTKLIGGCGPI